MLFIRNNIKLLIGCIILGIMTFLVLAIGKVDFAYAAQDTKFSGGNGKQESPYIISTPSDLLELMTDVNTHIAPDGYFNCYFKLNDDIDISDIKLSPIGDFTYPFKGTFDGNGKSIQGLDINLNSIDYVGLFGVLNSTARVENLAVYGSVIGFSEVGGIAGFNYGEIANCKSCVSVRSSNDMSSMDIGGICGYNRGHISGSYFFGDIVTQGLNTGGIVGVNGEDGQIISCFNVGDVTSNYYCVGGISGHNDGIIEQCFNNADIKGYSTVGGIVGTNIGRVAYSYNTALISATDKIAGGLCGSNDGELNSCYSAGAVSAKNTNGGICGYNAPEGVLENCFYSVDKFIGYVTGKNETFVNCGGLQDVDMVAVDTLTAEDKLEKINSDLNVLWAKRRYDDTHCYYPELQCFYNFEEEIEKYSKESAGILRQAAEIRLGLVSCEYDGTERESDVWLGQKQLTKEHDYVCQYSNNIYAGLASVTVTLTNYYVGESVKEFEITKKPIEIEWANNELVYNGGVQYPNVAKVNGTVGNDVVTFNYSVDGGIVSGQHKVTASLAQGGINDSYFIVPQVHKYSILPRGLVVDWDDRTLVYNKKAQCPSAEIVDGLIEGDSVELVYSDYRNNIAAGNGYKVTVSVSDKYTNYVLKETKEYTIEPKPIYARFEFKIFNYSGVCQYPVIDQIDNLEFGDVVVFEYSEYENNIEK